eukprot:gene13090-17544_t
MIIIPIILLITLSFFGYLNSFILSKYSKSKSNGVKNFQSSNSVLYSCKSLVVWDCDGVLVDSEALLKQGEVEALADLGFVLTVDDCVRLFSGVSPDTAAANFLKEYKTPLPDNFFKLQIEGSMDLFRRRLVPLMTSTVQKLHSEGVEMCVASGSPRSRVELCLELAGMKPYFPPEKIFTRELVPRGKPAPDLFLYSAEKMGYEPTSCLVVEDSTAGIQAALNARMEVIGYLGGGHTNADWYRKDIYSFNIPIASTEKDVFDLIKSKLCVK